MYRHLSVPVSFSFHSLALRVALHHFIGRSLVYVDPNWTCVPSESHLRANTQICRTSYVVKSWILAFIAIMPCAARLICYSHAHLTSLWC